MESDDYAETKSDPEYLNFLGIRGIDVWAHELSVFLWCFSFCLQCLQKH